jgi:hypothetical protein
MSVSVNGIGALARFVASCDASESGAGGAGDDALTGGLDDDLLVGGIGISGDGVDQDDMIALLGAHNAGVALNGAIGNAPPAIRADRIELPGQPERLRYVSCPQAPFIDTNEDDVCDGK